MDARHRQQSLVVMSTTEEVGRVALSLGARPADTAHDNSAEGVSKTWVEEVTLVFGGDECPQGACVGKDYWDASVEQQLVANAPRADPASVARSLSSCA
jgi:hypothetical protein